MKKYTLYPDFLQLAFRHGTPKRALMTVMLVGTILTLINNWDVILEGGSLNYVKVHFLIVFLSVSLHAVL